MRILIASHTGMSGHRGWKTTQAAVEAHFAWKGLAHDVESFVKSCIHCLCTAPGKLFLDHSVTPCMLLEGTRSCTSIFVI